MKVTVPVNSSTLVSVGLETAIRERSAEQFVQNGGGVEVETLVGSAARQFIADLNAGIRDVSPCERVFLSQNSLEPLLMGLLGAATADRHNHRRGPR